MDQSLRSTQSNVHQSQLAPVVALERFAASCRPALSAIVVIPDSYETVRELIRALSAQTVSELLELVIVVPSLNAVTSGLTDLDHFCSWRIVELGVMRSVTQAKRAGIRCATGSIVVLTEDHSLPEPTWAQSLIAAHRDGWAAVGPAMNNGNPQSLISWADFIIGYGPWFDPPSSREVEELPGHNTSYKRDILLEFDDRLEELLASESTLHRELLLRGHRLYLEAAARTFHSNFTDPSRWIPYLFYSGRLFAAHRASSWPLARRIAYSTGSSLIPLVRLKRLVPGLRRSRPDLMPRVLVPLLLALVVDAFGQSLGYALGTGRASEKVANLEFHRNDIASRRPWLRRGNDSAPAS